MQLTIKVNVSARAQSQYSVVTNDCWHHIANIYKLEGLQQVGHFAIVLIGHVQIRIVVSRSLVSSRNWL